MKLVTWRKKKKKSYFHVADRTYACSSKILPFHIGILLCEPLLRLSSLQLWRRSDNKHLKVVSIFPARHLSVSQCRIKKSAWKALGKWQFLQIINFHICDKCCCQKNCYPFDAFDINIFHSFLEYKIFPWNFINT